MPYQSNDSLPQSVRDKYSGKCQSRFRAVFNDTYAREGEERAFQNAHAAARRCQGEKKMTLPNTQFNIFSGLLKTYNSEDGKKRLKTVASSTIRDRAGDTMTEKAIRKMAESAKENMTIFLNHKYEVPESIFGSVEDVNVVQRGEVWDLDFDIRLEESNDRAVKTYEAIANGTKLGTSIGAQIIDGWRDKDTGGVVLDDVALLEASIVGIPANPRSWVQYAVKSITDAEPDDSVTITTSGGGEITVSSDDPAVLEKARVWVDVDPKGAISTAVDTDAPSETEDKAIEPEVSKELTPENSITTPDEDDPAHPENNEPVGDSGNPAQEGQETEPESADTEDDAEKEVAPDAMKYSDIAALVEMLRTSTAELVEARKQVDEERDKRLQAETEAVAAKAELLQAKDIVDRVADLPIGRRSVVKYHVNDFRTRFGHLYGSDFVRMLETKDDAGN